MKVPFIAFTVLPMNWADDAIECYFVCGQMAGRRQCCELLYLTKNRVQERWESSIWWSIINITPRNILHALAVSLSARAAESFFWRNSQQLMSIASHRAESQMTTIELYKIRSSFNRSAPVRVLVMCPRAQIRLELFSRFKTTTVGQVLNIDSLECQSIRRHSRPPPPSR